MMCRLHTGLSVALIDPSLLLMPLMHMRVAGHWRGIGVFAAL